MATLAPIKTPTRARDERTTFIQLLRRIHFHAGILVGPFLLVTAITGFLYALAPAAEQVIHADQIHASSTAQTVALDRQVATAQEQHPALQVSGVIVGKPGDTTRVMFDDATLKSSSYRRAVFVDPGTGAVRGDTVLYGSGQSFPERAWLSELHRRLLLGDVGRIYSELAASWLAPITLVGLILWWRGRRNQTAGGKTLSAGGKTLSARGRTLRSHRRIGVVAGAVVRHQPGGLPDRRRRTALGEEGDRRRVLLQLTVAGCPAGVGLPAGAPPRPTLAPCLLPSALHRPEPARRAGTILRRASTTPSPRPSGSCVSPACRTAPTPCSPPSRATGTSAWTSSSAPPRRSASTAPA